MRDRLAWCVQVNSVNRLGNEDRKRVAAALVEGHSTREVSRITGVARNTVNKLLLDLGAASSAYQSRVFRKLVCERIQCDEIWTFVGEGSRKNPKEKNGESRDDVWTWVALDTDSKLVPAWYVGMRNVGAAYSFIHDLAGRLLRPVHLTTDGHRTYLSAAANASCCEIDNAMLLKIYGNMPVGSGEYNGPTDYTSPRTEGKSGGLEFAQVREKYSGGRSPASRRGIIPFEGLSNGFIKKVEDHERMIALHYMAYNFHKIHQSLCSTPAMVAGITDHVWDLGEICGLLA